MATLLVCRSGYSYHSSIDQIISRLPLASLIYYQADAQPATLNVDTGAVVPHHPLVKWDFKSEIPVNKKVVQKQEARSPRRIVPSARFLQRMLSNNQSYHDKYVPFKPPPPSPARKVQPVYGKSKKARDYEVRVTATSNPTVVPLGQVSGNTRGRSTLSSKPPMKPEGPLPGSATVSSGLKAVNNIPSRPGNPAMKATGRHTRHTASHHPSGKDSLYFCRNNENIERSTIRTTNRGKPFQTSAVKSMLTASPQST
ncbi:hypothetical protein K474DRAFT_1446594 [Panus rudis PR-1116 ss-1]|nr:hypothetical protein K474DRAFT_1446594 [Panus rudis PR-1116 ss-1]